VAFLHSHLSRLRVLSIALLAILAVVACNGAPTETETTSLDMAAVSSEVHQA
jgi:hypothetical protein